MTKKTPPANATPPRCATCRHYQQTSNRKPSKLDLANDPKLQPESWMYGHCLAAPPQMVKPAAWEVAEEKGWSLANRYCSEREPFVWGQPVVRALNVCSKWRPRGVTVNKT